MMKTVSFILAGALATSVWTIKAEAEGKGNPTGGLAANSPQLCQRRLA